MEISLHLRLHDNNDDNRECTFDIVNRRLLLRSCSLYSRVSRFAILNALRVIKFRAYLSRSGVRETQHNNRARASVVPEGVF